MSARRRRQPTLPRPPRGERRPYRRPRILVREALEAAAVDCSAGGKENVIMCPSFTQS